MCPVNNRTFLSFSTLLECVRLTIPPSRLTVSFGQERVVRYGRAGFSISPNVIATADWQTEITQTLYSHTLNIPSIPIYKFTNCLLPQGHRHITLANVCCANISRIQTHTQSSHTPIYQYTNKPIYKLLAPARPQTYHARECLLRKYFTNSSILESTNSHTRIHEFTNSL